VSASLDKTWSLYILFTKPVFMCPRTKRVLVFNTGDYMVSASLEDWVLWDFHTGECLFPTRQRPDAVATGGYARPLYMFPHTKLSSC
jgi:hypothetical protein